MSVSLLHFSFIQHLVKCFSVELFECGRYSDFITSIPISNFALFYFFLLCQLPISLSVHFTLLKRKKKNVFLDSCSHLTVFLLHKSFRSWNTRMLKQSTINNNTKLYFNELSKWIWYQIPIRSNACIYRNVRILAEKKYEIKSMEIWNWIWWVFCHSSSPLNFNLIVINSRLSFDKFTAQIIDSAVKLV